MTLNHIIASLMAAVTLIAITTLIVEGVLRANESKRTELRNCIAQNNDVLECRLAVYGQVGR